MERFASSSLREVEGYGADQGDHGVAVVKGRYVVGVSKCKNLSNR